MVVSVGQLHTHTHVDALRWNVTCTGWGAAPGRALRIRIRMRMRMRMRKRYLQVVHVDGSCGYCLLNCADGRSSLRPGTSLLQLGGESDEARFVAKPAEK